MLTELWRLCSIPTTNYDTLPNSLINSLTYKLQVTHSIREIVDGLSGLMLFSLQNCVYCLMILCGINVCISFGVSKIWPFAKCSYRCRKGRSCITWERKNLNSTTVTMRQLTRDQKDPTCFFASSLEAYVLFYYSRGREMTATQAIFQQMYGFSLSHRGSKDILLA